MLSSITFQAARLQSGSLDPGRTGETLARNAKLMDRLIGDLLTFSTLQAGHLAIETDDVEVRDLVRHLCNVFGPLAQRKGISLSSTLPDHDVHLRCDHDRIIQALGNVVANAVKFTPDGGQVRVELDASGQGCVFRVRDTGSGIAPEQVEDVFRPFWQADPGKQGLGLGLAIARGIVVAHGGEIGVERAGPGTTFVILIPYRATPKASASVAPPPICEPQQGHRGG